MNTKPWYLSKTILVNLFLGLCGALVAVVPALSGVAAWVNSNAALIGMTWSALNILLRFISKDKISLGD